MSLDLHQPREFTDDMFATTQPAAEQMIAVLDEIYRMWGRCTLQAAGVPAAPEWAMRREMMSPSFTTRFSERWTVRVK